MKRLYIFRHAKAETTSPKGDKQRKLSPRGRRNAEAMGRVMAARALVPDLALVSTAKRTAETWELAAAAFKPAPAIRFSDVLYLAEPGTILALLRIQNATADSVMVLGHNPGLEEIAIKLLAPAADRAEKLRRAQLMEKFPTGALAVLDCDIAGWGELKTGTARLVEFLKPRELD